MSVNNTDNNDKIEKEHSQIELESAFDEEDDFVYTEKNAEDKSGGDTRDEEAMSKSDKKKKSGGKKKDAAEKLKKKEKRGKKLKAVWKKVRMPLIIAACALLGVCIGIFAFALSTIDKDRIMNNVYIERLDVGGLTYDNALAAVNATYLFENAEITLTDGNTSFQITGADIGLSALPEETTEKAFNYCKDGNVFQNAWNAVKLLFTDEVIVPAPRLDTDRLDEKLNECGNLMLGELKQHYIAFDDSTVAVVYPGETGYNGDPSTAREQVMQALAAEIFNDIHVDFFAAAPDDMTIEQIDALIYKDPVNAEYVINGNEVTVTEGETGRYINKEEAEPILPNIQEGGEPVGIPFYVSQPDVTQEELSAKLFANTLASYSTSYGGSTANRAANVARAASLINGAVVAPGDVFSFNNTVGRRTKENGFYTAKEYINGESVDGIGGGTCQVSSTLYSAVLYADMSIVERLNHMMSVGYIPLGQDATVSDSGVDFRFRNTSDYPIKISAYTGGGTITVSVLGTAWEPKREVKITNTSSMSGENTLVRSTRYVYSNGELISTDTLNSSTYMPHSRPAAQTSSDDDGDDGYDYDDDDDYDE